MEGGLAFQGDSHSFHTGATQDAIIICIIIIIIIIIIVYIEFSYIFYVAINNNLLCRWWNNMSELLWIQ